MASYPKATSKVLNAAGHVPMKAQMALASRPHAHFQEGNAPGTRSIAETTHGGMADGGPVIAQVGNPGNPGVGKPKMMNPITAAAGSAPGGSTQGIPGARGSARSAPRSIGNIAKGK